MWYFGAFLLFVIALALWSLLGNLRDDDDYQGSMFTNLGKTRIGPGFSGNWPKGAWLGPRDGSENNLKWQRELRHANRRVTNKATG